MDLADSERQALAAIEACLTRTDPRLARRLRSWPLTAQCRSTAGRRLATWSAVWTTCAVVLLLTAVVTRQPGLVALGCSLIALLPAEILLVARWLGLDPGPSEAGAGVH